MPWRESSVVEQRLRFVVLAEREGQSFADLCREFGISRQTGYTWRKRFKQAGSQAVKDRSRRPHASPRKTPDEIERAVVALRRRWPDWGAPKLQKILLEEHPSYAPLAVRTLHRILQRHQLVRPADGHPVARERFERAAPNELWQMDFKGPGFARSSPVGPLSILDDHSRYVVALRQLGSTRAEGVRDTMRQTFENSGLPEALLVDHGVPWWNAASPWGWSELAVWIMRQGIRLLFSGIRHPQTQGKVERMHGALQRATSRRNQDLMEQSWLDLFRKEYNHVRPHQALAMATPASRWRPSPRCYCECPREWEYPATMQVLRVGSKGQLTWQKERWEVSSALRHQTVGVEQLGDRALVYYCHTPLRELNLATGRSYPIPLDVFRSLQR